MSSDALRVIRELRAKGCKAMVLPDGRLEITGTLSPELKADIALNKAMIVAQLSKGNAAGKVDPEVWSDMCRLAHCFGATVEVPEPWGRGTLWSLSPRGAAVDVGAALVTFWLSDVKPIVGT